MKPKHQKPLIAMALAAIAFTASSNAAVLQAGDMIGIDFSGANAGGASLDPTNNFNLVSPIPAVNGSLAAGSLISTTNVSLDNVGFSWSANNAWFNNADSISIAGQPDVFNESNLTDWMGISNGAAPTVPGVITLTFTGLDNAFTYDVIVGAGFNSGIADTTWASGTKSGFSDTSSGPNSFVTLTELSTDGSGNLVITGTGTIVGTRADIAVVSALHLTAIPEPSAALLGGLGLFALLRRRR